MNKIQKHHLSRSLRLYLITALTGLTKDKQAKCFKETKAQSSQFRFSFNVKGYVLQMAMADIIIELSMHLTN